MMVPNIHTYSIVVCIHGSVY